MLKRKVIGLKDITNEWPQDVVSVLLSLTTSLIEQRTEQRTWTVGELGLIICKNEGGEYVQSINRLGDKNRKKIS